jgi:hypothetical protein
MFFVFGWLNLVLQPCLAEMMPGETPAGVPAEHCEHAPSSPGSEPCISMLVQACVQAHDLHLDTASRSGDDQRSLVAADLIGVDTGFAAATTAIRPQSRNLRSAADPPLTIRFCTFRN